MDGKGSGNVGGGASKDVGSAGGGASKGAVAPGGGNGIPKEKVGSDSVGEVMKAPGGDGSYISREEFEKDPQGYFSGLHAEQKGKK